MAVIQLDSYRAAADATRARVLAAVLAAFGGTSVDDAAVDAFLDRVVPLVVAGQLRLGALTDAYLAQVAAVTLGGAPEVLGVGEDTLSYAAMRGVPPEVVYARPWITARAKLAAGAPFDTAMAEASSRLDVTVQNDLQLAERHAARAVVLADDRITGFRRAIRPGASKSGTCGLCLAASTQRYGKEDLLPIHGRCHCVVMPIFGGKDPAREINLQRYREAAKLAREDGNGTARGKLAAVRLREHGELGPMLTKRGDRFTGPSDIPAA